MNTNICSKCGTKDTDYAYCIDCMAETAREMVETMIKRVEQNQRVIGLDNQSMEELKHAMRCGIRDEYETKKQ